MLSVCTYENIKEKEIFLLPKDFVKVSAAIWSAGK